MNGPTGLWYGVVGPVDGYWASAPDPPIAPAAAANASRHNEFFTSRLRRLSRYGVFPNPAPRPWIWFTVLAPSSVTPNSRSMGEMIRARVVSIVTIRCAFT